jgi:hypothetical protein
MAEEVWTDSAELNATEDSSCYYRVRCQSLIAPAPRLFPKTMVEGTSKPRKPALIPPNSSFEGNVNVAAYGRE